MVSGRAAARMPARDVSPCTCPGQSRAMTSAKPYIGCKIGLISKAQNRYEGILYTIDKVNSTVVLAKGELCKACGSLSACPEIICGLAKIGAQVILGCRFVSFIEPFLSTSQVSRNGGTTH